MKKEHHKQVCPQNIGFAPARYYSFQANKTDDEKKKTSIGSQDLFFYD